MNMPIPLAPRNKRHQVQSLEKELLRLGGMKRGEEQLILFLTGAGGSGKSEVISNVLRYGKGFCQSLGQPFDSHTIVVTALTGVAATSIHGETLSSAALLNQKRSVTIEQMKEWENARLVIIDEISFAKGSEILTLHKQLSALKEARSKKYGGLNIVFAGDFRQLKPVGEKSLYEDTGLAQWHDWVNCFIKLCGNHRFGNDPEYGEVCKRFRDGVPTDNDFEYMNERVLNVQQPDGTWTNPGGPTIADAPSDTAYAIPKNQDRCAINDNIFAKHLQKTHFKDDAISPPKHTIIIRSDNISYRVKGELTALTMSAKCKLWTALNAPIPRLFRLAGSGHCEE